MVLSNKSKYLEYFTFIGAAINIVLNLVFIHFWGYMGAALATLVTSASTGIVLPFVFRGTKEYVQIFVGSFRQIPVLAGYVWDMAVSKTRER